MQTVPRFRRAATVPSGKNGRVGAAGDGDFGLGNCGLRNSQGTLVKDRRVVPFGDLDHPGLVDSFGRKVLLQTFAQHRRMDPHDVVGHGVVIEGATKQLVTDLVLTDLA